MKVHHYFSSFQIFITEHLFITLEGKHKFGLHFAGDDN